MSRVDLKDPRFPQQFASEWIAAWNRRDVEAVLSHYVEDAYFESPVAAMRTGSPVVRGKDKLRDYWIFAKGLASLHFTFESVAYDPGTRTLVVFYTAERNGKTQRACEQMVFDAEGRQIEGRAYYGYDVV